MNTTTLRRATIAAAATTLVLTACEAPFGADSAFVEQSSVAIAQAGFEEMRDVTSLRMFATIESTPDPMRFDVHVDVNRNCTGAMEVEGGRTLFRRNADSAWLRSDEDFWRAVSPTRQQADQVIARVGTSWVKTDDEAGFEDFCDLKTMLDDFTLDKDDTEDSVSKGEVELIGETEAIPISGKEDNVRSTVWVSVVSPHRVVKMVSSKKGVEGTFYFEEFDVEVRVEAPAKEDVVDLSELER